MHLDSVSPAGLLLEHVDDILHQQVPLQPVHAVPVQQHLVPAGRTPEAAARSQRASSCGKVGIRGLSCPKSHTDH